MAQQNDIIKDQDFLTWTNNWSESEFDQLDFNTLFVQGQSGVRFSDDSMFDITSTIGLDTILVRFGLNPDDTENQFQVFMYGIDGLGTRVTPYYGSSPIAPKPTDEADIVPHEVPDVVARQWVEFWKKALEDKSVNVSNFNTNYGYLRGYNYAMRSVVDTLFPGPDIKASTIDVFFGLHKYLGREANPDKPRFTFGLILHSLIKTNDTNRLISKKEEENVYYDFSVPCPPTCHE